MDMAINIAVNLNKEMESWVLECGEEVIVLRAETFEEAIDEAQDIAREWA
jgi:hypothetical protein